MSQNNTKVIHIIPAAFDYFDDIQAAAFSLIEREHGYGVESEAFTLHYGAVSKKQKQQASEIAPSRRLIGYARSEEVLGALSGFDVVHFHCPFFGMAVPLMKWKSENAVPLVLSYHRDFKITDLFSVFVSGYNKYFLPKLVRRADAICFESEAFYKQSDLGRLKFQDDKRYSLEAAGQDIIKESNIHLTKDENKLKLIKSEIITLAYIKLYQSLIISY